MHLKITPCKEGVPFSRIYAESVAFIQCYFPDGKIHWTAKQGVKVKVLLLIKVLQLLTLGNGLPVTTTTVGPVARCFQQQMQCSKDVDKLKAVVFSS